MIDQLTDIVVVLGDKFIEVDQDVAVETRIPLSLCHTEILQIKTFSDANNKSWLDTLLKKIVVDLTVELFELLDILLHSFSHKTLGRANVLYCEDEILVRLSVPRCRQCGQVTRTLKASERIFYGGLSAEHRDRFKLRILVPS